MGDRDYFRKDFDRPKSIFQPGFDNAIVSLVIFNLVVFTTLFALHLIYLVIFDTAAAAEPVYTAQVKQSLNISADTELMLRRPWTVISFMFTHFGFWRLFSNILWLWSFGYIFQNIAGSSRVIPLYIYSGLAGGILFIISSVLLQSNEAFEISGAASAIVGIAVAATVMSPAYKIFPMLGNGIPLWVLTAIFLILDLGSISMSTNLLIAHLGAAGAGYLFTLALKKGNDPGAWMYRLGDKILNLFNPGRQNKGWKSTLFYKAEKEPYVKKPNLTQQKLDELLDKINQHGYESLSDDEKEFLRKASERL